MTEPTPADSAVLDQMIAGVRSNLNTVIRTATIHLRGLCPVLGEHPSRELVIAHLTGDLSNVSSADACFEMLALAAVELAEQQEADSI